MSDTDDDKDKRYFGILLEELRDQNKAILEAVAGIRQTVDNQPTREEFTELSGDVKTIRAAVTDLSAQVNEHERRITHLEADAA